MKPSHRPMRYVVLVLLLGTFMLGCVERPQETVSGPEVPGPAVFGQSPTGYWCLSGGALPDPQRVKRNQSDIPCSEDVLNEWRKAGLLSDGVPPAP